MPRLHWVSWGERDVECFPSVVLHQYDLRLVINDILCPFAGVPHRFPSLCQFLCWNLKGFVNRCTGGGVWTWPSYHQLPVAPSQGPGTASPTERLPWLPRPGGARAGPTAADFCQRTPRQSALASRCPSHRGDQLGQHPRACYTRLPVGTQSTRVMNDCMSE